MTVDIDGTLTRGHGWKFLAEGLDRLPAYEDTRRRFSKGEIGEDQHLTNLMRITQGVALSTVEKLLANTPRIEGIGSGLQILHRAGVTTALLTHNPEYVCRWYQTRFGFDDFEGTSGQAVVDGTISAPRNIHAAKSVGLLRLCDRLQVPPTGVVHIGDSRSDAVVFPLVGAGVALNASSSSVEESADLALHLDDFRDLVRSLGRIAPRRE